MKTGSVLLQLKMCFVIIYQASVCLKNISKGSALQILIRKYKGKNNEN